jgi:hypothetical protein
MRSQAIRNTHPTVVTINGDVDCRDSDWNVVEIDEVLVEAEVARLQAVYNATQYRRDRQARYNAELPTGDQFDALLKGFNQLRLDGQDLPADLDGVIGIWLGIKSAIPKE